VVIGKECIMRCSSAEWITRNGCWRFYQLLDVGI